MDVKHPVWSSAMEFVALQDTVLKEQPIQSSALKPDQKVSIPKGSRYQVHSHCAVDNDDQHVKIAFKGVTFGPQAKNTWYAFNKHIEIDGPEPGNNPKDNEVALLVTPRVKNYNVPLVGMVALDDPIITGGHFTWAEATKGGKRKPANKSVVEGIIRLANQLEEVREQLGNRTLTVNSWYRDPATNKAIGGASQSRHMNGDAVDFNAEGLSPAAVHRQLESWWGSRGGLASASNFTHIDLRGYKARWTYPN
jgi:hypothetical protein